MTYLEKLKIDYPGWNDAAYRDHCGLACPTNGDSTIFCDYTMSSEDDCCIKCWNREIPGTEPTNDREEKKMEEKNIKISAGMRKTKAQLLEEIDALQKEVKDLEKYKKYEAAANETYAVMESFMKAGFTREEAFTMTGKFIDQAATMNRR